MDESPEDSINMIKAFNAALVAVFFCPQVHAEAFPFVELQIGWKNPGSTSTVLQTWCNKVFVYEHFMDRSCGGRNPTFNGRAGWEFDGKRFKLMQNVMVGWHHFSHLRDGSYNDRGEIHFDEIFLSKKWGGRP